MSELTVVATTVARPEAAERVLTELNRLVEPTRREDGCLEYVMHRSLDDPAVFVFVERWASEAHLRAHMTTDHFRACMAAIEKLTVRVVIDKLVRVP